MVVARVHESKILEQTLPVHKRIVKNEELLDICQRFAEGLGFALVFFTELMHVISAS